MLTQTENPTYLPARQVCNRYGVSDMSLWRWLRDPRLNFPKPMVISKRRYWKLADLVEWDERQRQRSFSGEAA